MYLLFGYAAVHTVDTYSATSVATHCVNTPLKVKVAEINLTFIQRRLLHATSCQRRSYHHRSTIVYTTAHQAGKSKEDSLQSHGALRLLLYQSPLMISICSPLC